MQRAGKKKFRYRNEAENVAFLESESVIITSKGNNTIPKIK